MDAELNNMKVGDRIHDWAGIWDVFRVPGGWIFAIGREGCVTSQFVPLVKYDDY